MTQTHETIPVAGSSFLTQLTTFLEKEDADRFRDMFTDFVVSGGVIATVASLTQTPTALTAYCGGFYSTESGSITFADNSITFVIADANTTGNLTGYTRVTGTHYLTSTAGTQPALPSGTINIATVTTVGGSITAVTDTRNLSVISEAAGGLGVNISTMTAGALLIGTGSGVAIAAPTATNGTVTVTGGAGTLDFAAVGISSWSSRNNRSVVATNTTATLIASEIMLRHSTTFATKVINAPANQTNTITTAGPTAGGRDQAGAFTASSWVYFYWIWNGATISSVSSATPPPVGPTLPSGYTFWCFDTAYRLDGASALVPSRNVGAWVLYNTQKVALTAGVATVETAVDLTTFVPPYATQVRLNGNASIRNNLGGNVDRSDDVTVKLRWITGTDYFRARMRSDMTTQYNNTAWQVDIPQLAQNVFYIWTAGGGFSTTSLDLDVLGYEVGA